MSAFGCSSPLDEGSQLSLFKERPLAGGGLKFGAGYERVSGWKSRVHHEKS